MQAQVTQQILEKDQIIDSLRRQIREMEIQIEESKNFFLQQELELRRRIEQRMSKWIIKAIKANKKIKSLKNLYDKSVKNLILKVCHLQNHIALLKTTISRQRESYTKLIAKIISKFEEFLQSYQNQKQNQIIQNNLLYQQDRTRFFQNFAYNTQVKNMNCFNLNKSSIAETETDQLYTNEFKENESLDVFSQSESEEEHFEIEKNQFFGSLQDFKQKLEKKLVKEKQKNQQVISEQSSITVSQYFQKSKESSQESFITKPEDLLESLDLSEKEDVVFNYINQSSSQCCSRKNQSKQKEINLQDLLFAKSTSTINSPISASLQQEKEKNQKFKQANIKEFSGKVIKIQQIKKDIHKNRFPSNQSSINSSLFNPSEQSDLPNELQFAYNGSSQISSSNEMDRALFLSNFIGSDDNQSNKLQNSMYGQVQISGNKNVDMQSLNCEGVVDNIFYEIFESPALGLQLNPLKFKTQSHYQSSESLEKQNSQIYDKSTNQNQANETDASNKQSEVKEKIKSQLDDQTVFLNHQYNAFQTFKKIKSQKYLLYIISN